MQNRREQNVLENPEMTASELEFSIFCIENVAIRLGVEGSEVYDALAEKSDLLDSYIIPAYPALHTQGKDYIVDDILRVMNDKGIEV